MQFASVNLCRSLGVHPCPAGPARPAASLVRVSVQLCVFVAALAVSLDRVGSGEADTSERVRLLLYGLQVLRVAARAVPAEVVQVEAGGDRAYQ